MSELEGTVYVPSNEQIRFLRFIVGVGIYMEIFIEAYNVYLLCFTAHADSIEFIRVHPALNRLSL